MLASKRFVVPLSLPMKYRLWPSVDQAGAVRHPKTVVNSGRTLPDRTSTVRPGGEEIARLPFTVWSM